MFAKIHKLKKHKKWEVKLEIIKAIELRKDANYILIGEMDGVSRKDMETMLKQIRKAGISNVVAFMLSGNPDEAIQTVNVKRNK